MTALYFTENGQYFIYTDADGDDRIYPRRAVTGLIMTASRLVVAIAGTPRPFDLSVEDRQRLLSWFVEEDVPPVEIRKLAPTAQAAAYAAYKKETLIPTARVTPAPDEGLNVEESQEEGLQMPSQVSR